jgi:hypothetical protein
MIRLTGAAALIAVSLLTPFAAQAEAGQVYKVTPQERRDCKVDYKTYCRQYKVGSQDLRACMSRASKRLSDPCVRALYQAGEISRSYAQKLLRD